MNPQRFGVYVLGALGGMALLLTVLGTYVIAASALSQVSFSQWPARA